MTPWTLAEIALLPPNTQVTISAGELITIVKEVAELRDRVEALEDQRDREEGRGETAVPSSEIGAVRAKVGIHEMRLDDAFEAIEEHDAALAKLQGMGSPPKPGTKTEARIEQLTQILKDRGGTVAFKTLRRELDLKPNQFSALVSKLDKRRYVMMVNPRARDEKALRLRAFT